MSQATSIISFIRTDLKSFGDKQFTRCQAVHNSWGYGKVMPMALMGILGAKYGMDSYAPTAEQGEKWMDGLQNLFFVNTGLSSNFIDLDVSEGLQAGLAELADCKFEDIKPILERLDKAGDLPYQENGCMFVFHEVKNNPEPYRDFLMCVDTYVFFVGGIDGDFDFTPLTGFEYMDKFIKWDESLIDFMPTFDDFVNFTSTCTGSGKHIMLKNEPRNG